MTQEAIGARTWTAWLARPLLLLAALLTLSTVMGPRLERPQPSSATPSPHFADRELYQEITSKVAAGQDYYSAAASTQRAHGYPTAPPWTFREPTLAWLQALIGNGLAPWGVSLLLAAAAVVLMRNASEQATDAPWARMAATLLFGVGLEFVCVPSGVYLHENWAAVFIGLSLASWRSGKADGGGRWGMSVAFGLMACLFRELAVPYLVVMAAFAAIERRRAELAGWIVALVLLAGALSAHFALAAGQHLPGDGFSPGWVRFGGWPFAVLAARNNIMLAVLPAPLASLVLLASLLGLASLRSPWASRVTGVVVAFLALFMAVGRPDNYYWGMMVAPLLAMGLPFAPGALRGLLRAASGPTARSSAA